MKNLNSPKVVTLVIFLGFLFTQQTQTDISIKIDKSLENARATFQDSLLTVTTGKVTRQWRWTGAGFLTVSLKNVKSGKEWCGSKPLHLCDWNLPTKIDNSRLAKLISIECTETDDEHFTSKHLLISALIQYDSGLELRFLIRAYPDATGIWTALEVKSLNGFSRKGSLLICQHINHTDQISR